jgi:hypothetical protein
MSFTLLDDQRVAIPVPTGIDDAGNVVPVPPEVAASVTYATQDPDGVLTLTDNGDGSAVVQAAGGIGTGTLVATATLPDGTPVLGSIAFDVVASPVNALVITPGTPEHI